MIRHDSMSQMLIIIAVMVTLYLATFHLTSVILFPVILLLSGFMLQFYTLRQIEMINHLTEERTLASIGYYTALSLIGIALSGYFVQNLPFELTGVDAYLFGYLMAISEEQFFRGFITNFFLLKLKNPFLAIIISGAVFSIYHLARYGTQLEALIYVLLGGCILSWAAYRSRRLSPVMLAHAINNVIAVAMGGS